MAPTHTPSILAEFPKIKLSYESQNAFLVGGHSGRDRTFMRFIRLGDT